MDEALGKTFKALRQSKNIEPKALANENISYAQLLKFEAGKTSITAEKLMYLLDAINVAFDEFDYSYRYLADTDELFFDKQIERAFWHGNISMIEHLLAKINAQLLLEPDNKRLFYNKMSAEASLCYLGQDYNVSKRDVTELYNYLLNIQQWTRHECFLFMNCIVLFTDQQLEVLIYRLLHPQSTMIDGFRTQSDINASLLSVIRQMLTHRNFGQIRIWFSYLEDHALPDFNMYERAMFTYLKLLYKFRSNPSQENLTPCENCLEAFKTLGCFGVANQEARLLETYRKESHI